MHCFRAFLDSSSPLHHRGASLPRWVPQSRSALSPSERVRATISVFTLTVLRRLINATSANSIKSKQGMVTQVGCPRHVLTRTRTRGAEGQRTQRRMGSNDPSSSTAAGNARLIRQLRATLGRYYRAAMDLDSVARRRRLSILRSLVSRRSCATAA